MVEEKRRFTATRAAQRVGIAYSTMREHIRSGSVSAERKGRSLWIDEDELRRHYPDAFGADEDSDGADVKTEGADDSGDSAIGGVESADARDASDIADGHAIEVEVLRVKLEYAERESDTLRSDVEHLRGLTSQQADSVQNLTEEVKGLTIALHHEQGQRRELQGSLDEVTSEMQSKKRGLFGRMLRRKKLHRVGPR